MIYGYIEKTFKQGEPIFLDELPRTSDDYLRQEMKKLVDNGKLERLYNGVYFLPYTTVLGTKGKVSIEGFIEKKYLKQGNNDIGYITGLQLSNAFGFTSQNPSCYEVCSNEASTKQRKLEIDGTRIIIYQPVVPITKENKTALQFLDLMLNIDRYSEISGVELERKLKRFVDLNNVDFQKVGEYLPYYPDRVYRNIYVGGMMNELVSR